MKMYNELIVDGEKLENVSNIKIEINNKKRGTGGNHPRLFFLDCFKVKKIIIR